MRLMLLSSFFPWIVLQQEYFNPHSSFGIPAAESLTEENTELLFLSLHCTPEASDDFTIKLDLGRHTID